MMGTGDQVGAHLPEGFMSAPDDEIHMNWIAAPHRTTAEITPITVKNTALNPRASVSAYLDTV